MNKLEKTCLTIAAALWITIAIMTYTNIWVTDMQTIQTPQTSTYWDYDNGGMKFYTTNQTSTIDTFPHDKITTTIYVTLIPALFFTLTPLFASIETENKKEEE